MLITDKSTVILDTCILIHFANANCFSILRELSGMEFITTQHVILEVTNKSQLKKVNDCINSDLIRVARLATPRIMEDYFSLCRRLGKGESSCIALASANNWIVCSDDKKRVPKTIKNRLGINHLATTGDLLETAVTQSIISETEKSEIQNRMNRH